MPSRKEEKRVEAVQIVRACALLRQQIVLAVGRWNGINVDLTNLPTHNILVLLLLYRSKLITINDNPSTRVIRPHAQPICSRLFSFQSLTINIFLELATHKLFQGIWHLLPICRFKVIIPIFNLKRLLLLHRIMSFVYFWFEHGLHFQLFLYHFLMLFVQILCHIVIFIHM